MASSTTLWLKGKPHVRWATGTPAPNTGSDARPSQACPNTHSLPAAAQLAHCHTPRQRYIARRRCQRYRASPLPHPLSTATQLAHCHIARPLSHNSPIATQLAHHHTARPPSHSSSTITQLVHHHTARPPSHSSSTITQLVHCHTARHPYIAHQHDKAYQLQQTSLMIIKIPNSKTISTP